MIAAICIERLYRLTPTWLYAPDRLRPIAWVKVRRHVHAAPLVCCGENVLVGTFHGDARYLTWREVMDLCGGSPPLVDSPAESPNAVLFRTVICDVFRLSGNVSAAEAGEGVCQLTELIISRVTGMSTYFELRKPGAPERTPPAVVEYLKTVGVNGTRRN